LAQMRPAPYDVDVFPDNLIDFRARHCIRKTGTAAPIQRLPVVKYRLQACILDLHSRRKPVRLAPFETNLSKVSTQD
jgi:hypothetical protein